MKVLVITPIQRRLNGAPFYFPRAMQSIYDQDWSHPLYHYSENGGDDAPFPVHDKYHRARWWMLQGDFDAVFYAESDMILPPDALSKLAALNSDIAYGLYCWRSSKHEWNAYTALDRFGGKSLSDNPDAARKWFGQVTCVAGLGQGCTLVKRHVLERLHYPPNTRVGYDWWLAMEAQRNGFTQTCDLSVVCGHIDRNARQVIWPDVTTESLYRVEDYAA